MSKKGIEYYLEKISEIWGGIIIFIPFLAIGSIGGFIIHKNVSGINGLILGILLGAIFLALGIYIVITYFKGKGTFYVISRTIATSELDKKEGKDDVDNIQSLNTPTTDQDNPEEKGSDN
ncbi:hypothetical protein [Empedobacter brevis]|uniref:hypothetical protein n=1 Tax=Empedobacter brevis TaxID=247 RepID=UPI002FE0366A